MTMKEEISKEVVSFNEKLFRGLEDPRELYNGKRRWFLRLVANEMIMSMCCMPWRRR